MKDWWIFCDPKPALFAMTLILFPMICSAEVASRDVGEQAAVAKAQAMLRQISSEKEALQAEKAQLEEELAKKDKKIESLDKKLQHAEKSLKSSADTANRYQDAVAAQRARMEEMRGKFQALVDKYRELVAALKLVEMERVALQDKTAQQVGEIEACGKKNGELYQAALDMIEKYENKGVWEALLQQEPVTQLKRVEIENIVDEAKYHAEKLRVVDAK